MTLRPGDNAPDFEADTTEGRIAYYAWLGNGWEGRSATRATTRRSVSPSWAKPPSSRASSASATSRSSACRWTSSRIITAGAGTSSRRRASRSVFRSSPADKKVANLYDIPQRERHLLGAQRVRERSQQEGPPDAHVSGEHRAQLRRGPQGHRLATAHRTDKYKVATPVNRRQSEDVIIVPAVSNEDAEKLFAGGWKELKPYLRVVAQPKG